MGVRFSLPAQIKNVDKAVYSVDKRQTSFVHLIKSKNIFMALNKVINKVFKDRNKKGLEQKTFKFHVK